MNIAKTREIHNLTGKKLRRARYLFIFLCRKRLLTYGDDYMDLFVSKAREYKLYAENTSDKDIRFYTLRRLYKLHNPDKVSWYEWVARYHWKWHTWDRFA